VAAGEVYMNNALSLNYGRPISVSIVTGQPADGSQGSDILLTEPFIFACDRARLLLQNFTLS
jgi:hypothetical protein